MYCPLLFLQPFPKPFTNHRVMSHWYVFFPLKTYTLGSRSPLLIRELDVFVSDRLSSSMFCQFERSLSDERPNLFQNLRQLFSTFVTNSSSSRKESDETVDRGYGDDAVLPCSRQTFNTPLTANRSLDTSVSRSYFFKNFVLPERIPSVLSNSRITILNRSRPN